MGTLVKCDVNLSRTLNKIATELYTPLLITLIASHNASILKLTLGKVTIQ